MGNTKALVLVITSLTFLISGAISSQLFVQPIFAAKPAYCFEHNCPTRSCSNNPANGTASCCWKEPGVIPADYKCQTCHVNTDTGEFENCSEPTSQHKPDTSTIAPPPSGVAPPPPTESCPENTALDAQGNCTPLTQTPEQPPTNQTPSPKGGPGKLLPEGVFGGPTTSPQQEVAPPTAEDGSGQPPSQPLCPEGQVLDEETGLCVLEEPPSIEQQEAAEEPQAQDEQSGDEDQQQSEDGGGGDEQ